MDFEVLHSIILQELANDQLQLETEVERLVNSDIDIPNKVLKIKAALKEVATNEMMANKWLTYLSSNDNNDLKKD